MEENLYCKCGYPINVLHDQGNQTCRTDGLKFQDGKNIKKQQEGWHCFRCPGCEEWIEKGNLVELGNL